MNIAIALAMFLFMAQLTGVAIVAIVGRAAVGAKNSDPARRLTFVLYFACVGPYGKPVCLLAKTMGSM